MTKKELRKEYKAKRLALPATERMKLDDLLLIQFQRLPLGDVTTLLSYFPLEKYNEMNTHLFTRYMEHAVPQLQVAYPVVDGNSCEMKAVLCTEETDFEDNEYSIPEPVNGEELSAADVDLVFVPLLAFDKRGFRVGYGKGFYDRYLKKCRPDVMTVGFSYFDPVSAIEDATQFDVPLSFCITPYQLYEF